MDFYVRRREPADLGRLAMQARVPPGWPVRVVAPGVCYILADPREIARVLEEHPEARVTPLERRSAGV